MVKIPRLRLCHTCACSRVVAGAIQAFVRFSTVWFMHWAAIYKDTPGRDKFLPIGKLCCHLGVILVLLLAIGIDYVIEIGIVNRCE